MSHAGKGKSSPSGVDAFNFCGVLVLPPGSLRKRRGQSGLT